MTHTEDVKEFCTYRPKVLFVDSQNDARSILAEGILNYAGRGKFEVFSAGVSAVERPHPFAIELLDAYSFNTLGMRSKHIDEVRHIAFDFIIELCEASSTATTQWPEKCLSTQWFLRDPSAQTGSDEEMRRAFSVTFSELGRRLYIFANLPFETLTSTQLQRELEALGDLSEIGK